MVSQWQPATQDFQAGCMVKRVRHQVPKMGLEGAPANAFASTTQLHTERCL